MMLNLLQVIPSDYTTYGLTGAVSLLLLNETIRYFRAHGGKSNTSGDKPVEFWRAVLKDSMENALDTKVVKILDKQTEILADMRTTLTVLADRSRGI